MNGIQINFKNRAARLAVKDDKLTALGASLPNNVPGAIQIVVGVVINNQSQDLFRPVVVRQTPAGELKIATPSRDMNNQGLVINDPIKVTWPQLEKGVHPSAKLRMLGRFLEFPLTQFGFQRFMENGMTSLPRDPSRWQTGDAGAPINVEDDDQEVVFISEVVNIYSDDEDEA
ncbi:hypothetical protein KCU71_g775, partial [Aureobasidium melanogenum]